MLNHAATFAVKQLRPITESEFIFASKDHGLVVRKTKIRLPFPAHASCL